MFREVTMDSEHYLVALLQCARCSYLRRVTMDSDHYLVASNTTNTNGMRLIDFASSKTENDHVVIAVGTPSVC